MIYIWYKYYCLTDNVWKNHNVRVMFNQPAPTVCHCHGVAYKTGSLMVCKEDCEIKKITNANWNGGSVLDKNTATLGDVIDRIHCICECLDYKTIINHV